MNNVFKNVNQDKIKVMLTGTGADDYLAGSNREIIYYLSSLTNNYEKFDKELNSYCKINNLNKKNVLTIIQKSKKYNLSSADGTEAINNYFLINKNLAKFKNKSFTNLKDALIDRLTFNKLPRNLRYEDRNSMINSVENRVPFLDHILVEYCLSLSDENLVRNGLGKYILRDVLYSKYNYTNAYKKKQSVQTPQTKWLISKNGKRKISSVINKKNSFVSNFINTHRVNEFINSNKIKSIYNSNYLWQWLSLEIWYEEFFN